MKSKWFADIKWVSQTLWGDWKCPVCSDSSLTPRGCMAETGLQNRQLRAGQKGSHSIERAEGKGRSLSYVILWSLQAVLGSSATVCGCIFEGRVRRRGNRHLLLPFLPTTSRGWWAAKEQRQHIFRAAAGAACSWHGDIVPSSCVMPPRAPAESLVWPLLLSV